MSTATAKDATRRSLLGAAALGGWPGVRSWGRSVGGTDWWAGWRVGAWAGFTTANLPQLDASVLPALRAIGARIARVGLPLWHDTLRGNTTVHAADWATLRARLDQAHALGLGLVVLALLDDGVTPQPLWQDGTRQQGLLQCWAELGARLGRHPALAGVDLFNEPHPVLQGAVLPLAQAQALWWALALRVLTAFRTAGGTAPVVLQPVLGAHPSAFAGAPALPVHGVVYSPHFYTPHDITHQGVSAAWPRRVPYPAHAGWGLGGWDAELGPGAIDAQRLRAEMRGASQFARRTGEPVYVGEFGCVRWAPDGAAQRWVQDCLHAFAAERWSWSFHSFRTWTGWDAEVAGEAREFSLRSRSAPTMLLLKSALARQRARLAGAAGATIAPGAGP